MLSCGPSLSPETTDIVVRNWGALIALVGVTLIAEGFETHVPKGYIYFAMAFSVGVEMLNLRMRARREARNPIRLRKHAPGSRRAQETRDG